MIEPLEQDLGKPVITGNQATMWHAMRLAGVQESIAGYGRLLRTQLR
jgi:maleate cis-trans isomerase